MSKQKTQIEFRYYNIPEGDYVLAKLGPGWEQEYGLGYNRMLHFHNYFEIGYCYHGKGELIIEDRVYNYSDDCFSLIPQNVPHVTVSAPGNICKWEFLFIDIEAFIRDVLRGTSLSCDDIIRIVNKRGTMKTKKNHAAMAKLIRNIIEESRRRDLYYRQSIIGYLYALVVEIMRLDEEREMAKHVNRINNYIKSAIDYIGENYADEIKIQELADVCGLSESHFRRIFVESMGMKPVEYVNYVRIQKACALIRKEDLSMEDICYRVGYQTPSTFNRNFRIVTGMSPREWKAEGNHPANAFHVNVRLGWEADTVPRQNEEPPGDTDPNLI